MKCIAFLLLITPLFVGAQKFAIMDMNLKAPILYTDSLTDEQTSNGFFPVQNQSTYSLIANIQYVRNLLAVKQRAKAETFELRAAKKAISVERVPYAYGDRYTVYAITTIENLTVFHNLTTVDGSNKKNREYLDKLLAYLKSNKDFFKAPNEIKPKVYARSF
jgi:hypothetical protein